MKKNVLKVVLNLFTLLLPGILPVFGQSVSSSTSFMDSAAISVSNISIDGEFNLRGLTSGFPYPVMSTISVVDRQGNAILGLADTSRWLSPEDISEIGLPMADIWQPLLEYHEEDPAIPDNPDIYAQLPLPRFTELRETARIPTSTMLVMDFSGSMREEIADAKFGARLFVEQLRPYDLAGIIQFDAKILVRQGLSSDFDLIRRAIDSGTIGVGTAIYDGVMSAIEELKLATGRTGLIVYTDGNDNSSKNTKEAVIDSAKAYGIPVHSIALGNQVTETHLIEISEQTGGLFFRAATSQEMIAIYDKLSEIIKNFYVMAHASPDPVSNNTFRVVDISVNAATYQGRGTGVYFVPALPQLEYTDLAVTLSSVTDSVLLIGSETRNAVQPGEGFQYNLELNNLGPAAADTVDLVQFLPDSVVMRSASLEPLYSDDNILTWRFADVPPGAAISIVLDVQLAAQLPADMVELVSRSNATALNDTLLENNIDFDSVLVFTAEPPVVRRNYDLRLGQSVMTDTSAIIDSMSFMAVVRGESYDYELTLENLGPGIATDVLLYDSLPDSVTATGFNILPSHNFLQTYFWRFDSLNPGASIAITFEGKVSENLVTLPFELLNISAVTAERDTNATNDSTATLIYAVARAGYQPPLTDLNYDLSVRQTVMTDSSVLVAGDTVASVYPGEEYNYSIRLENNGPGMATNVTLINNKPDSVALFDYNIPPTSFEFNNFYWQIDSLAPGELVVIDFKARADEMKKNLPSRLLNISKVTAAKDTNAVNDSSVTAVFVVERPGTGVPQDTDVAILLYARTDSFAVSGEDTIRFVRRGESYTYHFNAINESGTTADNVVVSYYVPELLTVTEAIPEPATITEDSVSWNLGFLLTDSAVPLQLQATVIESAPVGRNVIVSEAKIYADNEPAERLQNNVDRDTVFNLVRLAGANPMIEANPPVVNVGDSVEVRVQVRVPNESWDLWVFYANGDIDSSYADSYIAFTTLLPDRWFDVQPLFQDTRLTTDKESEAIQFELRTVDVFGDLRIARASVQVQSSNEIIVDRNVLEASRGVRLKIDFSLSSNRTIRLDLFDITGSHVTTLADGPFNAGWNTIFWDGSTNNGMKVGSGTYLIAMQSGEFTALKKIMVVR
jgi:VWFA-related protein